MPLHLLFALAVYGHWQCSLCGEWFFGEASQTCGKC